MEEQRHRLWDQHIATQNENKKHCLTWFCITVTSICFNIISIACIFKMSSTSPRFIPGLRFHILITPIYVLTEVSKKSIVNCHFFNVKLIVIQLFDTWAFFTGPCVAVWYAKTEIHGVAHAPFKASPSGELAVVHVSIQLGGPSSTYVLG